MAGSDTTATAIRTTFLYIITTPRVLAKLLAEISGATLSSPISDVEAKKMPYLQATIKEGLRIWPPAIGLYRQRGPTRRRHYKWQVRSWRYQDRVWWLQYL